MKQPPTGTTTTTFVVRFWREWSGAESRWRGRIEHVESGQRADFVGVEGLLAFLERFGIGAQAQPGTMRRAGPPGPMET